MSQFLLGGDFSMGVSRSGRVLVFSAAALLCAGVSGAATASAAAARTTATQSMVGGGFSDHTAPIPVAASGPGKTIDFEVFGYAPDPTVRAVRNVRVSFDAAALGQLVTVSVTDKRCSTKGSITTCLLPSVSNEYLGSSVARIPVTFRPKPHGPIGPTAALTYTVSAPGAQGTDETQSVQLGHGPDLLASSSVPGPVILSTGQRFSPVVTVSNRGDAVAKSVSLFLFAGSAMRDMDSSSNCLYAPTSDPAYQAPETVAFCTFDVSVAPGQTYELSKPVDFVVRDDAFDGYYVGFDFEYGHPSWIKTTNWQRGTGAPLRLTRLALRPAVATQTNLDPGDHDVDTSYGIRTAYKQDPAAVAGSVTGRVGSTVTAIIGVRDDGKATIDHSGGGIPAALMTFTVPHGTDAVRVPTTCAPVINGAPSWTDAGKPGYAVYSCRSSASIRAGTSYTVAFSLKIVLPASNAKGKVVVSPCVDGPLPTGPSSIDSNLANDTSYLVVNPTRA
jgi:hypothetical protein